MPTERLVLIGAGGHAKVVLDAWRCAHPEAEVEVRDDNRALEGTLLLRVAIRTPVGALDVLRARCHVAIGDNSIRRHIGAALAAAGSTLVSVIHPQAIVAADATIEGGTFVAAGAVIAPDVRIAAGVIVNHLAIVDHDCAIGEWCHIAPGVVLGGGVKVGARCLLGSGVVVLPGVTIADDVVIGAGAVVTRDVIAGAKLAGIPAKDLNERR
jgi:sugar O-acyltransferase (sialic acid O-acetyltransferase NeuD family)